MEPEPDLHTGSETLSTGTSVVEPVHFRSAADFGPAPSKKVAFRLFSTYFYASQAMLIILSTPKVFLKELAWN